MIMALIACDHAEPRNCGHLPTASALQSSIPTGASPVGGPGVRRGRAVAGEALRRTGKPSLDRGLPGPFPFAEEG